MLGTPSGPQPDVAGHNSSYKRDRLLELGDELEAAMEFDAKLHAVLRERGHELYMEAGAVTQHVYMTMLGPFVREHFHIGRAFAATRSSGWSAGRRWAYALASPAIPLVRARRIFARMREMGWLGQLVPGVLPPLALALATSAAGEMMGCAFGIGRSAGATLDLDFRRERFVSPAERDVIWGAQLRYVPRGRREL